MISQEVRKTVQDVTRDATDYITRIPTRNATDYATREALE